MDEPLLYSQLSLTRRSSSLPKIIKVDPYSDLSKLRGSLDMSFLEV